MVGDVTVRRIAAVVAALVVGCAAVGCSRETGDEGSTSRTTTTAEATTSTASGVTTDGPVPAGRVVTVSSITDGDTFRAGEERVRLIGIDTPEVAGEVECYGAEASAALERLIPVGTSVTLVSDVDTVDRYERTLAYVFRTDDGLDVNLAMATDGFATPLTVPPNVAREDDFADAAASAREAGRGLWAACDADTASSSTAPPRTDQTTTTTGEPGGPSSAPADAPGRDGCDPSYPDVCIPPSPPDLDCGDIPHRRFTVLPPDPHRFDGGGDGIGCESG